MSILLNKKHCCAASINIFHYRENFPYQKRSKTHRRLIEKKESRAAHEVGVSGRMTETAKVGPKFL